MADAITHSLAGLKFFGHNKFDEAIVEFAQALVAKPNWTDAMNALAMAESKLGRHEAPVATIERAMELDPNDAFAFTSLSIFLQRIGKISEAETATANACTISWKEDLKKNPNAPPPMGAGEMQVVQ